MKSGTPLAPYKHNRVLFPEWWLGGGSVRHFLTLLHHKYSNLACNSSETRPCYGLRFTKVDITLGLQSRVTSQGLFVISFGDLYQRNQMACRSTLKVDSLMIPHSIVPHSIVSTAAVYRSGSSSSRVSDCSSMQFKIYRHHQVAHVELISCRPPPHMCAPQTKNIHLFSYALRLNSPL